MEPPVAVGLAGNIVQFVDFAGRLISGTKQLYQDSDPAFLEIETLRKDMKRLAELTRPPQN